MRQNFTLNYGLRYDYYVPLKEADNRIVKFNIVTGEIDPDTTPFYQSKKNNFQPALSATYSPTSKTVIKAGFGIFVGPGQTEDQIQPIEAERISTTVSSGPLLAYPVDPAAIRPNFINNPNNRSYQPRAYSDDYTLPEKVYQYTASVQRELGGQHGRVRRLRRQPGPEPVPAQHREPDRSACSRTARPPARSVREFDIVTCANGPTAPAPVPGSTITGVQNPYAEIDYKTSGGHDSYNAMQLALTRRSSNGLDVERSVHAGLQQGQHRRLERGGHRAATTRSAHLPTSSTTTATTTSTSATRST